MSGRRISIPSAGSRARISRQVWTMDAMRSVLLEIHTDDGVVWLSGPCSRSEAFVIDTALRPLLVGKDPTAIERLWDVMYRSMIHGRKGETMMAISVVDCGLWEHCKWSPAPDNLSYSIDPAVDTGLTYTNPV